MKLEHLEDTDLLQLNRFLDWLLCNLNFEKRFLFILMKIKVLFFIKLIKNIVLIIEFLKRFFFSFLNSFFCFKTDIIII
jgi:hypothetical protein